MTDTRKWSAATVVLIAAIFAASWFLLISPKRGEAADLRDKATTQEVANARLQQEIKMLMAQQQDLPRQRARLAELRTQIPDNPALPSLIRDLTAAGRKVGVSIDSMAPAVPVAMVAPVTAVAPTTTTSDTSSDAAAGTTDSSAATTGTGAPVASPPPPADTLFQVPLNLNVTGSYFELEQFLNKLERLKRSLLVTGFSLTEATTDDAAPGDLTITLNGRVFLTQKTESTTTTPVAVAATSTGQ